VELMRKNCPECGQQVKEENLVEHLERVHPNVPRRKYADLNIPKAPVARRKAVPWGPLMAVLLAAVLIVGIYFAVTRGASGGQGRVYADHAYYDFGHVPQAVSEHDFTFQNVGEGPLLIVGAWTSCGCTTARIEIGGDQSPQFGMHNNPAWTGRLAPGATAKLSVFYDATEMPDMYVGERSIFLKTDDLGNPEPEFVIHVDEA
jgi:hypothetical protein